MNRKETPQHTFLCFGLNNLLMDYQRQTILFSKRFRY